MLNTATIEEAIITFCEKGNYEAVAGLLGYVTGDECVERLARLLSNASNWDLFKKLMERHGVESEVKEYASIETSREYKAPSTPEVPRISPRRNRVDIPPSEGIEKLPKSPREIIPGCFPVDEEIVTRALTCINVKCFTTKKHLLPSRKVSGFKIVTNKVPADRDSFYFVGFDQNVIVVIDGEADINFLRKLSDYYFGQFPLSKTKPIIVADFGALPSKLPYNDMFIHGDDEDKVMNEIVKVYTEEVNILNF